MARRALSFLFFAFGALLLLSAIAMVAYARTAPAEGLQDLGRLVAAILLASAAGPAFGVALLAARDAAMPRPVVLVALLGALLGLVMGIGLLSLGMQAPAMAYAGAFSAGVSAAGLLSGPRAWRKARAG